MYVPVSCSHRLSLSIGDSRSSVVDVDKQKPIIILKRHLCRAAVFVSATFSNTLGL